MENFTRPFCLYYLAPRQPCSFFMMSVDNNELSVTHRSNGELFSSVLHHDSSFDKDLENAFRNSEAVLDAIF